MKISYPRLDRQHLLSAFVVLFLILTISAGTEYYTRKRSVLQLMTMMTRGLAQTIKKAAVNAILSYDFIEDEHIQRLLVSLRQIERQYRRPEVANSAIDIGEFARLDFYDQDISALRTTGQADPVPAAQLAELTTAPEQESVIGFYPDSSGLPAWFGVAVRRAQGGWLTGVVAAQPLFNLRREIGVGSVINAITDDSLITYIAIQDSLGILAATRDVQTLTAFSSDPLLRAILQKGQFTWRITDFGREKVFEGLLPFTVSSASYGLIRIGLNYAPLEVIQRAAIRQAGVRLVILFLIGFLLLIYAASLQSLRLLKAERERITSEVYRLQSDLRQREKLSAMGELAAGVAHEIRNPLNAIAMTIQRLAKEFPPAENAAEQEQLIQLVRREIARIGVIIQQFLTFARPAPLHRTKADLHEVIDKVVQLYAPRLQEREIKLHWFKKRAIIIWLDHDKCTQCLINLLENALEATPQGGEIVIETRRLRGKVRIILQDNGRGIPEANLPKIFNLYYTTKPAGTGLGLAQVYQIVSEHNGTIEVTSTVNQGTKFTITLPLIRE